MAIFARWLTLVILLLAAGIFAYGFLLHDYPISEIFMAAVSNGHRGDFLRDCPPS